MTSLVAGGTAFIGAEVARPVLEGWHERFLYRRLAALDKRRLTYRFVFLPETIGSLMYLNMRGGHLREQLMAGYVVTCVGDRGPSTYKRSRIGDSVADRAAIHVLSQRQGNATSILDFFPDAGGDERQYCSPAFNLPVGSLMRTSYGQYPEYHTSLDNRDFGSPESMRESVEIYFQVMQSLEMNVTYNNLMPWGEAPAWKERPLFNIGRQATP